MHSLPHVRARSIHALLACTLLVATPVTAFAQQVAARDSVDFSRLMTPAEMDSTGIARLTLGERAALGRWLARFTARAAMTARETMPLPPGHPPVAGMLPPGRPPAEGALPPGHPPVQMDDGAEREHHAESPSLDARPQDEEAAGVPRQQPEMAPRHAAPTRQGGHAGAPRSARLEATNGAFVMLRDGTRWEVYAPDRPRAAAWRPGDDVVRRPIPAPDGSYNIWLIDAQAGDSVAARFAGRRGGNPPRS